MRIEDFKELLKEKDLKLKFEEDLKKKNWFNIGGKAKVFYVVDNLSELVFFLKKIDKKEKIFIIGAGSNILISDNLFDGVVIKMGKRFNNISLLGDDRIIAGTGVTDKKLSDFAAKNSLSGFEFLSCIPGTVGGGIRMNAGCFEREFQDILVSIQVVNTKGEIKTIPVNDINFFYRGSDLSEDYIFLSATFQGKIDNKCNIEKKMNDLKKRKELSQPTKIKTSGSTFKNPKSQTDKKVWQLISESVSLDISFGDAYISKKHCNFFVNKGSASFEDMNNLINYVSKKVFEKTGINLEKEIKILR